MNETIKVGIKPLAQLGTWNLAMNLLGDLTAIWVETRTIFLSLKRYGLWTKYDKEEWRPKERTQENGQTAYHSALQSDNFTIFRFLYWFLSKFLTKEKVQRFFAQTLSVDFNKREVEA